MFGYTAHEDGVAAAGGQGVPEGHVGLETLARLVEVDGLQIGAEADGAGVGGHLAQHDLDQGGLAGAIGADDGQPVAAHDTGGEGLDDGAVAEALGDALQVSDQLARGGAGIDAEMQVARHILQPFGAFGAERLKRAGPAFVAGAAGGDRAVEGLGFALDGLGQAAQGLGLFLSDLRGPFVEGVETLVQAADASAFQPVTGLGDAIEEGAVMADHENGAAGRDQLFLELLDGEDVEVVGRLVEQHKVRLFGEGLGERGAADLAARQVDRRLGGIKAEGGEPGLGRPGLGLTRGGIVEQGVAGDHRFLRHIGKPDAGLDGAFAGVRLDLAHDDLHQGGFSGAIPSHETGPGARLDRDVDALEQGTGAVLQTDVLEGNKRRARGHGAFSDQER